MHTSGTTRRPKVVPLTHGSLGIGCHCVVSTLGLGPSTVCVNVMPLFHLHGLQVNVLATAIGGGAVVCAPGFRDGSAFFSLLRPRDAEAAVSHPVPNWYSAVPTIHQEVLRYAEQHSPPHSLDLIRNCSAALAPSLSERLEAALPGARVLPTYAMTEALPICSNSRDPNAPRHLGSVGPQAGPEVALMAEADGDGTAMLLQADGNAGSSSSEGEVVVRGSCVFKGYEQRSHFGFNPNESAFADGGWLRTGDRGWFDIHRHLHLTGRFKEIINRAGEKISPLTIEHALLAACSASGAGDEEDGLSDEDDEDEPRGSSSGKGELHGWVRGLLAFAAAHDELGEVVGVAVVCETGRTVTLTQLRRAGTKHGLSRHWLPELVAIVPNLPKGPTGKPARIGLAEAYELPTLSLKASMRTVDLRGGQPKEFEAARRAAARKSAAQRASSRKPAAKGESNGNGVTHSSAAAAPPPLTSVAGCVVLVASAMTEVSGEVVGEEDDP